MTKIPVLLLALAATGTFLRADALIQPDDMLAICGDSITEQKIYSVDMEDYLLMCQPTMGQRIAQFGWSGEPRRAFSRDSTPISFPSSPPWPPPAMG